MRIKLILTCIICFCFLSKLCAQQLWREAAGTVAGSYLRSLKGIADGKYRLSRIDPAQLKNIMKAAPMLDDKRKLPGFFIPLPDKTILETSIAESPLWEAKDAAQFRDIKTYALVDPVTKSSQGRIAVTAEGISGIIFSAKGTVYINPVPAAEPGTHILYYTRDQQLPLPSCGSNASAQHTASTQNTTSSDNKKRTYRLAVAATAEYTAWAGSQANALNYIAISINNVSAVYNRDLNIWFNIIAPNSILFTNAATDPYPGGNVYLDDAATNANQTAMDNILGSAAYDLGIVFNNGWDRGYVPFPFGFVCNAANKGKSAAGVSYGVGLNPVAGPQGPTFDLTVAHEMGHQFGAHHTYSSSVGICNGYGTLAAAFEPGAGSTLMSYGGYPNCNAYVSYAEMYFHAGSIDQVQAYITGAGNCATALASSNAAPVVSVAAASYNVPVSTPFTLTAAGSDNDGNVLLYNWEQMNANFFSPNPPAATNTAGPNFRSYPPVPSGNTRTFPRIFDLASGAATPYEVLPSVTRTMNFRITARDQSAAGPAVGGANVAVNFSSAAGPFTVTSQPTAVTWAAGSLQSITWNVALTNAAPVNCSMVDILFSVDGGITYPYTLLSNTSNDGTETITAPYIATQAGRIRVQSVNNIFFNINKANITITSGCAAEGTTFTPADSVAAPAGSSSLNLAFSPQYGTAFTPSGSITSGNPSTFLTIFHSGIPSCATYSYNASYKYAVHPFVVMTPGTYTFTPSTYGLVYNLYYESFNPGFPCHNFIASNTVTNGSTTTINPTVSAALVPGRRYVLVAGTYSVSFPVLPHAYSVPVSGGLIYTNPANPGAGYTYMYVVVDNATNLIRSIASTADLSNSIAYPGGNSYTVYGLSYSNASSSLAGFTGTDFNTLSSALLTNASYCGNLSRNTAKVTVVGVYSFNGNGNWSNAANWANNTVPPSSLPQNFEIVINPAGAGECILDVPVTILHGGKLTVQPGKKLRLQGNLVLLN